MISQLNEFAAQIVMTGSSGIMQHGVDFKFAASTIEILYDSTGPNFGFSFQSSNGSTNGPQVRASENRMFDLTTPISKLGLCTLTSTTSTSAGGAPQVRIHAWG